MTKDEVSCWYSRFAELPQCMQLANYEVGGSRHAKVLPGALLNALSGLVLVKVMVDGGKEKSLLSKGKESDWKMGITTPVAGYRDTYVGGPMNAITLLRETELEALFSIWRLQGLGLAMTAVEESL